LPALWISAAAILFCAAPRKVLGLLGTSTPASGWRHLQTRAICKIYQQKIASAAALVPNNALVNCCVHLVSTLKPHRPSHPSQTVQMLAQRGCSVPAGRCQRTAPLSARGICRGPSLRVLIGSVRRLQASTAASGNPELPERPSAAVPAHPDAHAPTHSAWAGVVGLLAVPALFAAGWMARGSAGHHLHAAPAFASMTASLTAAPILKRHSPQSVIKYKMLKVGSRAARSAGASWRRALCPAGDHSLAGWAECQRPPAPRCCRDDA
jgi:hypothetical protein